ncbi:ABC transporter ATP-binding protein [Rhodopirellula sp. SWK7]|uniref:ABC transporter ATP-binding protein n=1 Tax=Rhodopirellula sp. SWK7 TaxID=595460 RepID=UPI0005C7650E|nr:ABC transporter ATP-binding protein [Rhodopirellula sp. SWK7]
MIRLDNISITVGTFHLPNVSLEIERGRYAILMGKTGCGKTSLLETICGLRKPSSGSVWIQDVDVTRYAPGDREIGYVPQDLALFPTYNVAEHLEFGLKLRKASPSRLKQRRDETAEILGITHLLRRPIDGLSGGEAQRVALGRAIAVEPSVLLLDEPLSALDEETRDEMLELLQSLKEATNVTTLHVTHNLAEAERLADCRYRLSDSVLEHVAID